MSIVEKTIAFVKKSLEKNDASHDWLHIERVFNMANQLAKMEGIESQDTLEIIALGALLHDIEDYKYSGSETAGVEAARAFLKQQNYPKDKMDAVLYIVENISFKNELGGKKVQVTKELAIVKDADRLDAIGAIGIARCFVFSGSRNRPIYDPNVKPNLNMSKEEYIRKEKDTAINHFYEKLLKLKDLMHTNSGKKIAEKRHRFMEEYLKQFFDEWNCKS